MQCTSEIAVMAFRYALGRMTYVVSDCVAWLQSVWLELDEQHRRLIIKEINDALIEGQAGMDTDERKWRELLLFARKGET